MRFLVLLHALVYVCTGHLMYWILFNQIQEEIERPRLSPATESQIMLKMYPKYNPFRPIGISQNYTNCDVCSPLKIYSQRVCLCDIFKWNGFFICFMAGKSIFQDTEFIFRKMIEMLPPLTISCPKMIRDAHRNGGHLTNQNSVWFT